MGSADARAERNQWKDPIERLRYDMRENGYFKRGVLAGKPAHTNEHIQADCIQAILDFDDRLRKITEILERLVPDRTKTIEQGQDLTAQFAKIEKRLKSVEGRVTAFLVDNL